MTPAIQRADERPDRIILELDATGLVLGGDGPIDELLGRPLSYLSGRSARMWIHPEDLATADAIFIAVLGSPATRVPLRVRVGSNEHGWTPVACSLEHPDANGVLRITITPSQTVTTMDITVVNPLIDLLTDPRRDGILITNDTEAIFLSPTMFRMFGMAADEFFSGFGNVLHPDDSDHMVDLISRLLSGTDQVAKSTLRALRTDGVWSTFRISIANLSEDADFGVFITTAHELTDETAPSEPETIDPRLRHALSLASDPVMVIGDDRRVRFASSATASLIGRPVGTITGRSFEDVLTTDSVSDFQTWWQTPHATTCRLKIRTPAGMPRWVSVHIVDDGEATPLGNSRQYAVIALHDIDDQVRAETALEERESHFAALMRNSSSGVVVLDDDDVVMAPGHALEQVLGIRSDLAAGMHLVEWVDPQDRDRLRDTLAKARLRQSLTSLTVRQRVGDGTWRWIHWTAEDHGNDPIVRGLIVNLDDRTDEVQAHIDLEASERHFRAIVDHSFEVTLIADGNFVIMWASPSLTDLLGWQANDLIGRAILDFVHPRDVEKVQVRYDRARTSDGPEPSTPIRVRTASGAWRYVAVVAADRRGDDDVRGMILNVRDAEKQVASERALAESELRYRMLVENATDVVAILDSDATVAWVSPTVKTVLGISPDELIGRALGGIDDPENRQELQVAFDAVRYSPGASTRIVAPMHHADRSWRWVDLVMTNRMDEPGIDGIVAAYRDITERVEADRSRRESEERFRSLAESSPLGIFQLDDAQRCIYVNDRWCEITGQAPQDALGDTWREPFDIEERLLDDHLQGKTDPAVFDAGVPIVRADGTTRWCSLRVAPLTDTAGAQRGSVGTIDDITSAVLARNEARRLSSILEASPDLVLVFHRSGSIIYLNEAARRFFLVTPDARLDGLNASDLFDTDQLAFWTDAVTPYLRDDTAWQGEIELTNRAGTTLLISAVVNTHRDRSGRTELVSVTARDMSVRAELEARLEHQATHDPLTGLPNRSLLLDRLGVALARARRNGTPLAVIFADLDRFKVVNDGLGHATGDELLKLVATRLAETVRPGDTVARLGGDEFVIVCEDLDDESGIDSLAERLSAAVAEPVVIDGSEFVTSVSLGITMVTDPDDDPDQLIRDADAAMYVAKQRGRARWEIFDPTLRQLASDRIEVEHALRRALRTGELTVYYQPVIDASNESVVGAEALVRWNHPDRGLLSPKDFLDVAEDSGLITPIGDWVLQTACTQTRPLTQRDDPFSISVNLSARQVDDPTVIARITQAIEASGVAPEHVILEITESILMKDSTKSGATLAALKQLGVGLAIDDFGTGYSSLAYLQRYPVDILKIDRSFVTRLGRTPGDDAIVQAIIAMADALGLATVAEGVETDEQLAILTSLGCNRIQGYLKARPLSWATFSDFIDTSQR